ncbi:hypothetical protein LCGC14_2393660 [marine sediment metagenome]|uniref:Uncharacterized protein n=1 Tax=marine sediment metagenome TaxID=412755 RepID=A0A0F9E9R8_9ZZZZ
MLNNEVYQKYQEIDFGTDPMPFYYSAYQDLGGTSSRDIFEKRLRIFQNITLKTYVYGEPPDDVLLESQQSQNSCRNIVWNRWVKWIKDSEEAHRYFVAVDSVTAYT